MAQVMPNSVLSFQCWLSKAAEWGQTTTLESQQDVCAHLPQLLTFLLQISESLKHMSLNSALARFPAIDQLLKQLCWNPFVVGHEGLQKALMSCLCCLYSSDPRGPLELKTNDWIQDLLCSLFSGSQHEFHKEWKAIAQLGWTTAGYHGKLLKNTIASLISQLKGCQSVGGCSKPRLSAEDIRSISVKCIPIHTLPDIVPLLEALLIYHCPEPTEVLDELFLCTINNSIMWKKIVLSESAVLSLWLRHLPSLENAVLDLFQRLIAIQSKSSGELERVIKDSFLPQAACHPSIFMIIDGIFRNALLETDGTIKVITIIRLFTQRFIQMYEKDNLQARFPLRTFFPHNSLNLVMALLRQFQGLTHRVCFQHLHSIVQKVKDVDSGTRSHENLFNSWFLLIHFGDWVDVAAEQLLTSEHEISDDLLWLLAFYYNPCNDNQERIKTMIAAREVCTSLRKLSSNAVACPVTLQTIHEGKREQTWNFCTMQLIRHLCVTFLLYSSEWHTVAKDCISRMTQTQEAANEVSDVLARTLCRLNSTGMKNEKITKKALELLHDF
ncbi:Fanconi anemia group C protein [Pelobates fuscus]|uniref:Fanconi anemia group C protein n=1 Tax=Pelobates fuscus TaxID=191477 RepID=UPI002FE4B9D2